MRVRATINMVGLDAGSVVEVNPREKQVEGLLNAGFLVPVLPQRMRDELKPASRRGAKGGGGEADAEE